MPDSCSREGPRPCLLPIPPQLPSSYMHGISPSVRCMRAKRAPATGLLRKDAAVLRAPLATKPCLYSVRTVISGHCTKGEPGCCNLCPALTSLSGSLDNTSGSSGTSPRNILSTTTHKFHENKSLYTIVRRTAPLTAPAGIRRLGRPCCLRVSNQSQECFRKAIPYSSLCRRARIVFWPVSSHGSVLAVLLHIPAGHHRKAVTQVPGLNSYWI